MKKVLYILILMVFCSKVAAQEIYEQLNLDVSLGGEGYISNWESGQVTDVLLNPTKLSFSGKVRLNYYFHKNWGVHADFTIATYKGSKNSKDVIPSSITDLYTSNYYIDNPTLLTDKTHIYMRMLLGAQYRWEKDNWSLIPRLSVGFAHVPVDHCSFILKGIDNNEQYFMEYYTRNNRDADYGVSGRAFLQPGLQVGYKLKHLHLTMEVGYMQFLNKLHYNVEKTELYVDGLHEVNEISSKRVANKYNFNLGILIPLSWKIK